MSANASASKPSGASPSVSRPGVVANSCSLFKELALAPVRPKRSLQVIECTNTAKKRRVVLRGHGFTPRDPVVEGRIFGLEQRLILVEFRKAQRFQRAVGEVAEDEIHLPDAPVPGPEPDPPQPRLVLFGACFSHSACPFHARDIDRSGLYVIRMEA